jgi:AraC family transcriptional regulator, arabinose operon regulatory protein
MPNQPLLLQNRCTFTFYLYNIHNTSEEYLHFIMFCATIELDLLLVSFELLLLHVHSLIGEKCHMISLGRTGIPFIYKDLIIEDQEISLFHKHQLLSDFYIGWAGHFDKVFNNHAFDRTLDLYSLIYCYDGKGYLDVNGKSYIIIPGTAFYLAAGVKHTYGNEVGGYWSGYWVHFQGASGASLTRACFTDSVEVFTVGTNHKLQELYEDILKSLRVGHQMQDVFHASNALRYMLSYIELLRKKPVIDSEQERQLEEVLAYMAQNVRVSLSLDQLATKAHLSKYQFVRSFKKHTGITPVQYFTMLRIKEACDLLIQKGSSIQEISSDLGFENPDYFSTIFKRVMGCPPSKFVKAKGIR